MGKYFLFTKMYCMCCLQEPESQICRHSMQSWLCVCSSQWQFKNALASAMEGSTCLWALNQLHYKLSLLWQVSVSSHLIMRSCTTWCLLAKRAFYTCHHGCKWCWLTLLGVNVQKYPISGRWNSYHCSSVGRASDMLSEGCRFELTDCWCVFLSALIPFNLCHNYYITAKNYK